MTDQSLTVSELLARVQQAVVAEFPTPVWVRGEVTGYRRTSGGAAFFRLADPDTDGPALDVAGRGRVMQEIDRLLEGAGLGRLQDGVELRIKGTVGVAANQSQVRLTLLEVDPAFTAGRLALDRADVLKRMTADGSLSSNASLARPLVPLRLGLVTSRGSAAHADFLDHLAASSFRFAVRTAHTIVQGEQAPTAIATALQRVAAEPVEVVALIRGGGSKLELAVFDTEEVGRAIAAMPVPVITGIGHEVDRTVADEAAAISQKTPTAAAAWLVSTVKEFADRLDGARVHIKREAQTALDRHRHLLGRTASEVAASRTSLARQRDLLTRLGNDIAHTARDGLARQRANVTTLTEWFAAIDVGPTLHRGFALVTTRDGTTVIRSVGQVAPGDGLVVRLADGTVKVTVDDDE